MFNLSPSLTCCFSFSLTSSSSSLPAQVHAGRTLWRPVRVWMLSSDLITHTRPSPSPRLAPPPPAPSLWGNCLSKVKKLVLVWFPVWPSAGATVRWCRPLQVTARGQRSLSWLTGANFYCFILKLLVGSFDFYKKQNCWVLWKYFDYCSSDLSLRNKKLINARWCQTESLFMDSCHSNQLIQHMGPLWDQDSKIRVYFQFIYKIQEKTFKNFFPQLKLKQKTKLSVETIEKVLNSFCLEKLL